MDERDARRKEWRDLHRESEHEAGLRRRLSWAHGPERADDIISGRDPAANRDLASWQALGEPKGPRRG